MPENRLDFNSFPTIIDVPREQTASLLAKVLGITSLGFLITAAGVTVGLVAWFFGARFNDMLSGYRVMSHRFIKSFPALATGFETETEFTVHALELRMPVHQMTPVVRSPSISAPV